MHSISNTIINNEYEILNSSGNFVDFIGVKKSYKEKGYKVTLENDNSIIVSEDHIFISNGINMYLKSLIPNVSYLSTKDGDFYVKSISPQEGGDFYDVIDSENCEYYANNFINHNCSFLGSGDNFIAEKYLKQIEENTIVPPIKQEYTDNCFWIFEDPKPEEEYIVTIDVAAGHGDDFSTINILKTLDVIENKIIKKNGVEKKIRIKKTKSEQVAEYYGKVSPQILAQIAYQFAKRYNDGYVVVDVTGGYGAQTIEKLIEMGYENIHYSEISHKPTRDRLQGYIKKGQKKLADGSIIEVDLIPGFFIGNNRSSVLLEMQRAIHMGDVIIRSVRLLNELKTFINVPGNRVADHKRSFHDDSIMGLSIGIFTLSFEMKKYNYDKGTTKKVLDAMLNINDPNFKYKNQKNIFQEREKKPQNKVAEQYKTNSWLFNGMRNK